MSDAHRVAPSPSTAFAAGRSEVDAVVGAPAAASEASGHVHGAGGDAGGGGEAGDGDADEAPDVGHASVLVAPAARKYGHMAPTPSAVASPPSAAIWYAGSPFTAT